MSDSSKNPSGGALRARYDETPYRDQTFEDVDLGRLLGMARLFGLGPDEPRDAKLRVLDLACASGRHIQQQAMRYPEVQFTGIDFSRTEVEAGQKAIEESGATNVELILSDLRELEISPGEFDVILCRGAFSWVPDDVKDRIFELCRVGLKRSGIAVIAYLTYPGWKQREAIRELLAFRASNIEDPKERIRESALLLRLLHSGYSAHGDSPHAKSLTAVVESMQKSSSNAFLHDELGGIHHPCYFIQFADWASEWEMQYVAETDLGSMQLRGIPGDAAGILQELSPDFFETQQLIDFLVNRSGRTSLIARADAPIARDLSAEALGRLEFSCALRYARIPDPSSDASPEFESPRQERIHLDDPRECAMVRRMLEPGETLPRLSELEDCALATGGSRQELSRTLIGLIGKGYVDARLPDL